MQSDGTLRSRFPWITHVKPVSSVVAKPFESKKNMLNLLFYNFWNLKKEVFGREHWTYISNYNCLVSIWNNLEFPFIRGGVLGGSIPNRADEKNTTENGCRDSFLSNCALVPSSLAKWWIWPMNESNNLVWCLRNAWTKLHDWAVDVQTSLTFSKQSTAAQV